MNQDYENSLRNLRNELKNICNNWNTRQICAKSTFSSHITNHITSVSELDIYLSLGLKEAFITRPCLITEIEPFVCDKIGTTNIQRMLKGLPPVNRAGSPCTLHHIGQKYESPFAELFPEIHNSSQHNQKLHPLCDKVSWRQNPGLEELFAKERKEHWILREKTFLNENN